ncbi:MAG: ABC transporter permease [Candidatus Methanofastidiosa archaeon]|nr:ABC transporter permease [Candidatus Methanofastidiosa archaeon]
MKEVTGFSQMATIIKYEMLKFLRGKKLYIMFAIIAVFMGAVLIVPPAVGEPYPDSRELIQFFTQFINIVIILLVTLFGADSVVYDFEKGTAFVLYPNPVRRRTIFAGKFIAATVVSIGVLCLYFALAGIIDLGINGSVPSRMTYSLLLAIAYMVALMCVTFLISTSMRSTLASSVLVFAIFFLVMPMIGGILSIVGEKAWFLLTSMVSVVTDVLSVPFPKSTIIDAGAVRVVDYHPTVGTALLIIAVYAIPALALAYRQFIRKELL